MSLADDITELEHQLALYEDAELLQLWARIKPACIDSADEQEDRQDTERAPGLGFAEELSYEQCTAIAADWKGPLIHCSLKYMHSGPCHFPVPRASDSPQLDDRGPQPSVTGPCARADDTEIIQQALGAKGVRRHDGLPAELCPVTGCGTLNLNCLLENGHGGEHVFLKGL